MVKKNTLLICSLAFFSLMGCKGKKRAYGSGEPANRIPARTDRFGYEKSPFHLGIQRK